MTRKEVTEKAESGASAISSSITYGQRLGFIEEGEENLLQLTDLGTRLHYNRGDEEEVASIFRSAIRDFATYQALLKELVIDATDIVRDERVIQQSTVVEELDLTLGFDASESTLEEYANAFLKSLAKADLGEYVVGRKEYQTRLVVIEDFDTQVTEIIADGDDGEGKKRETKKTESRSSPEESVDPRQASSQSPAPPEVTNLNIDFSISADDDPENVLHILQAIRQGLTGEDNGTLGLDPKDAPQVASQLPDEVEVTRTQPETATSDEVANSGPTNGADRPERKKEDGEEKSVESADEEGDSAEPQSHEEEEDKEDEDVDDNSSLSNF